MAEVQENIISGSDELDKKSAENISDNLLDFDTPQSFTTDTIESSPTSTTTPVQDLLDFGADDNKKQESESISSTTDNTLTHANGGSSIINRQEEKNTENTSIEDIPSSPSEKQEEEIDLKSPLALWIQKHGVNKSAIDLIYWKDVKKSALFFASGMIIMLSLQCCSVIHVITSLGLALLLAAFLYRIAMTIVNAVQKTSAEHPFKDYLEKDHKISEEMVQKCAVKICRALNSEIKCFQKLFLISDVVESLKFGLCLWLASYVGSCFSLMTLVILGFILLFTIPKLYEEKQAEIDNLFCVMKGKVAHAYQIIEAKLPEKVKGYVNRKKQE